MARSCHPASPLGSAHCVHQSQCPGTLGRRDKSPWLQITLLDESCRGLPRGGCFCICKMGIIRPTSKSLSEDEMGLSSVTGSKAALGAAQVD